jgi:tetratricopeptide (TPR) repeat protein
MWLWAGRAPAARPIRGHRGRRGEAHRRGGSARRADGEKSPRTTDLHRHAGDGIGGRLGAARPGLRGGQEGIGRRGLERRDRGAQVAALRDPGNADIQNYIGYAYRRLRQMGPAMQYYQQALVLNRRHRSAHEHLGELYLVLGEPAAAEQQLATLEDICLIPCVETGDLKRAIVAYKARATQ